MLLKKQNCFVCFEKKTCPPLSYGCCHFNICFVCLEKWNDVNHGIKRCPVCREFQYTKPLQICCFRCRRPTYEQRQILFKVFFAQIIIIFVVLFLNNGLKNCLIFDYAVSKKIVLIYFSKFDSDRGA